MKYNIITFNNHAGINSDAILLNKLLVSNGYNSQIKYTNNIKNITKSDVGVWIQNAHYDLLNKFDINILYINEEWFDFQTSQLDVFDIVICKSKYAKERFFKNIGNVIHIPFISQDHYNPLFQNDNIYNPNKILHFMGRSIQKNTESLVTLNSKFTLHDPDNRYDNLPENISHITSYLSSINVTKMLNSHDIHICCSLYESWGHYIFEGLSTGSEIICSNIPVFREQLDSDLVHFIPVVKSTNLSYIYCDDNKENIYPLRESYFINTEYMSNLLSDFKPKGTRKQRRMLYMDIMSKNKKKILDFFKNI